MERGAMRLNHIKRVRPTALGTSRIERDCYQSAELYAKRLEWMWLLEEWHLIESGAVAQTVRSEDE